MRRRVEVRDLVHGVAPLRPDDVDGAEVGLDRSGVDVGPECRVIDEQRFVLDRRVGHSVVCGDLMT